MRPHAALLVLGVGALLLSSGASGLPNVPGDPTPPVVVPEITGTAGTAGWYVTNVTVRWLVSDPESVILETQGCDTRTLTADTLGTTLTCRATTDVASTTVSSTFKLDKTAPTLVPDPVPDPNAGGWHRQPFTIRFPGTDTTSGIATCTADQTYGAPNTTATPVAGFCTDQAGNRTDATYTVKYDTTAPTLTPDPVPDPNAAGWHRQPFTIRFPGTDATSGIATCTADRAYSTPETTGTPIAGSCTDHAGNGTDASYTVKYDTTAPQATSESFSRPPNALGWHREELTLTFGGTDLTSGVASCDRLTYGGPDGQSVSVSGRCRDNAGNESAARTVSFNYDESPPSLTPDPEPNANAAGWHRQPLTIGFPGTDAVSGVATCTGDRTYGGPDTGGTPVTGFCTDRAGNRTDAAYTVKYDTAAPTLTPDPVPDPNGAGWHRQPVTIRFPGADALSGIATCTGDRIYSTPDTSGTPIAGSCTDRAGNRTDGSYTVRYDATGPELSPVADRGPDVNGWYNGELTIRFPGADTMSGIATCSPDRRYSSPDNATASVTGSCTDRAGNETTRSFGFQYDATPPTLTPAASRVPDVNGWYNSEVTIRFPGADPVSGVAVCTPNRAYSTPDSGAATVSGSCTDRAGNTTTRAFAFKYDGTPPALTPIASREPDRNGWYNHELAVLFPGTDATSGIASCTPNRPYSAPDSSGASVPGLCTDQAGNTTTKVFEFRYDATAPLVTDVRPDRPPQTGGWYVRPVKLAVTGSDGLSGLDVCPEVEYDGPDGESVFVDGLCVDKAGNVGKRSFALKYDDTGPAVSATATREPDANGWYNHALTVRFAGADGASGLESCAPPQEYAGPDAVFAVVTGTCVDKAGNVGLGSLAVKYDSTAPQVSGASADRAPDANGWYNRRLAVQFHGRDATSDVQDCTTAAYAGPDNPSATLTGSCADRAGNPSGTVPFTFKYDGTPPRLVRVAGRAENRTARLEWETSPDTDLVEVDRSAGRRSRAVVVYRGRAKSFFDTGLANGVRYRYRVTAYDEARNPTSRSLTLTPTAPLISPTAGEVVSSPPRLVWRRVPGASYYNVQVWRNGQIFSAWPSGATIQLRRAWRYEGRRYRLTKGRYRWYVWPGLGARSKKKYGPLLGSSSFVVR